MKQTINQVKLSQIPELIQKMGMDENTTVNLTIETVEDDILSVFQQIGKEAQAKGLTEEILEELLANES